MSELLNVNTQAIIRQGSPRVLEFLRWFSGSDATWENFPPREGWVLELLKADLTSMASMVEDRIQELGFSDPQDFGT